MKKAGLLHITLFLLFLFPVACTEPFEIETVNYESVLVVECTITNEMKRQVVKLSQTSALENSGVLIENNASVTVSGNNGDSFNFEQDTETGYYLSDQPFSAQLGISYTLNITTQNGKRYTSSAVIIPQAVEIGEVYAERFVNPTEDKDGIQVMVDTEDPTGKAKYFRYDYEETYKITAPYPTHYNAEIINYNPQNGTYQVLLTNIEPEEICYSSERSTGIVQTSTNELNENRVFRFPIRYLSTEDPKIQTRYSILVKQYVQSVEAYTFYKIVKELGSVESLLSQGQPGYVAGNIVSETNPDEKVLGFFEASAMTSKRIYFNYEDFGIEEPPYFEDCDVLQLDYRLNNEPNERETIYTYITYYNYQVLSVAQGTIYRLVKPECGLCTTFSSNIRPDFWED